MESTVYTYDNCESVEKNNQFDISCISQAEDAEKRKENLEEAKKIKIEQDPSLPAPKQVSFTSCMDTYCDL